jgi:hypothetical protein
VFSNVDYEAKERVTGLHPSGHDIITWSPDPGAYCCSWKQLRTAKGVQGERPQVGPPQEAALSLMNYILGLSRTSSLKLPK